MRVRAWELLAGRFCPQVRLMRCGYYALSEVIVVVQLFRFVKLGGFEPMVLERVHPCVLLMWLLLWLGFCVHVRIQQM